MEIQWLQKGGPHTLGWEAGLIVTLASGKRVMTEENIGYDLWGGQM